MTNHEKKSPLRRPPLRQAGQSLQEEMDRLWEDKVDQYFMMIFAFFALAVMEWIFWFLKTPRRPVLITALAVGYTLFVTVRLKPCLKHYRQLKLGRDGERIVGQELEKLRAHGFHIYHDFLAEGFNIDHLVVGPTGVFTINTKTISKPKDPDMIIHYDGNVIEVPGTKFDRDPIERAKWERDFIHKWIQDNARRNAPVRPAIVFEGWLTTDQPKGAEVWVLNTPGLMSFIQNEWSELSQDDIVHISRILEDHLIHKQKQLTGESKYTTWSLE